MADRRDEDQTLIIPIPRPPDRPTHRKLRLEVVAGPDAGHTTVVEEKVIHVGSQPEVGNSLRLGDDAVSGIHLEICNAKSGLRLRDLGSTNGTWVDLVRVFDVQIPSGTVLTLGHSKVKVDVLDEQVAEQLSESNRFGELVGQSEVMRSLFALLERVAPSDETVLITGETGTGKEVCARSIVGASSRRERPLIVVDCGAIPPNLLESELFGHVRGAFTGAVTDHQGAFERGAGGTILLDEVGELPLELQTRLLRVVENRQIRRVGDTHERPLDLRILAATNRSLEEEVNRGAFRADLYYRLSVVHLHMPPLRERPEDIEVLARHILTELGATSIALGDAQLGELRRHSWPGNVRELRNYLRRLVLGEARAPGELATAPAVSESTIDLALPFKENKLRATERFERAYLQSLMRQAEGNISKAARIAQTDRTYLSRMLSRYKIV
jgi:two-component system, NtrC family, response regulator GlrR